MKEFIYLNTDYINSFIAQKNNGLPTVSENEITSGSEENKSEVIKHDEYKEGYNIGIFKMLGSNVEFTPERYEEINQLSKITLGREMLTKIIHDNAFDMFLKESNSSKYIVIEDYVKVYDLTTLAGIMEKEFSDMIVANNPSIKDITSTLNREQKRNQKIKDEVKKLEKQNKEDKKNIDFAIKVIKLLSKLFPSDVYAYTQNYFIPFKRNFFREEISAINYIFTSKTKIHGRVTGTLNNVLRHTDDNEFNIAINSLNDVGMEGLKVLGIKEDAKILIPISWYNE